MESSKLRHIITKKVTPALLTLLAITTLSCTTNPVSAHSMHYHNTYHRKVSINSARRANQVLSQLIANSNNKRYSTHHFKRTVRRHNHKVYKVKTRATTPTRQARYQTNLGKRAVNRIRHRAMRKKSKSSNWYADGLSNFQQECRAKVVYMESRGYWNISNYNGTCLGRFQLSKAYLMHHGHLDMSPKYQVHVADSYVKARYGNWYNALQFHYAHGWY